MSEEQPQQPAVGDGKRIVCGARATAPRWNMCWQCVDRFCNEREARARALKENGRLRTKRLAREAATDNGARESHAGPRSTAAHGWAALRWSAEHPRASGVWWWWDGKPKSKPECVEVTQSVAMDYLEGGPSFQFHGLSRRRLCHKVGGWWAGPVESPEPPDAATPPNMAIITKPPRQPRKDRETTRKKVDITTPPLPGTGE